MFQIDGQVFKIDMNALMDWVSSNPISERNIITTTTLSYPIVDEEDDMVEKEVTENKTSLNDVFNNIRYDFVKSLLNVIFTTYTNEIGEPIINVNNLTIGQRIALNTLIDNKIIIVSKS